MGDLAKAGEKSVPEGKKLSTEKNWILTTLNLKILFSNPKKYSLSKEEGTGWNL
jgi:hypothetical protein